MLDFLVLCSRSKANLDTVMVRYGRGQVEVNDELVMKELRGNDSDQCHVVGFAQGLSVLDFPDKLGNRRRLE